MANIPVTFEFDGREVKGHFSEVNGAGSASHWHFIIDAFYYGQMFTTTEGLRFKSQDGKLDCLGDYFTQVVMAWYE